VGLSQRLPLPLLDLQALPEVAGVLAQLGGFPLGLVQLEPQPPDLGVEGRFQLRALSAAVLQLGLVQGKHNV